jgi:parallel beta-helix repeat protein
MADLRPGGGGRRITAIRQAARQAVCSDDRRSPGRQHERPTLTRNASGAHATPLPEALEARTLLSTYYVSTSGSDGAPGSLAAPFHTIQQAANVAQPGDTVLVRAGTYRETVTPARSGASGKAITYKPYPGERVTISGADRVSGWSVYAGSIYKANQGWDRGDGRNQVFVDGRMMIEARWPNTTLDISRPKKATFDSVSASSTNATIKDSALNQPDNFWNGATIHFEPGEGWVGQTGRVTDSGVGQLSFSYDSMGRKSDPQGGDTYYLSGKFKALDSATEWFRDDDGTLYLWTPDGDNPEGHTVEAKRRDDAIVLDNRQYINIEGFDVFAAGITASSASHLRLSNLTASYLSHWTEQDTGWSQPHDTGIYLDGSDNVITDSVVAYSAGHGIVLSGSNSRAENNVIHDVAYNAGDSAGVRTVGSGHVVTRNTVYNTGRSAMKLSNSDSLKITHNLIHDAMLQTTDGGAIYTFGWTAAGRRSPTTRSTTSRPVGSAGRGSSWTTARATTSSTTTSCGTPTTR